MRFSDLTSDEQQIFREMTAIGFGRLMDIEVYKQHARMTSFSRSVYTEMIDSDTPRHEPSRADQDYILGKNAEKFLSIVKAQPDGAKVSVNVSNGLPGKVEILRAPMAQ